MALPLTLFLILGTVQLFLLFQGRVMAQYAAARATRAGSLQHGDCKVMLHAAVASLLPTFTPTRSPRELADAFSSHLNGKYVPTENAGHKEAIVWLIRESPTGLTANEEESFDLASPTPQVPSDYTSGCFSWNESPNMLNPFWKATLVPIDVDEIPSTPQPPKKFDRTPGGRVIGDGPEMLDSAGLTDAAETYRLLKSALYEGIQ